MLLLLLLVVYFLTFNVHMAVPQISFGYGLIYQLSFLMVHTPDLMNRCV